MKYNVEKFISEKKIASKINELSYQINKKYCNISDDIILIGLLKSSFVFLADLCRKFNFSHKIDFMIVSRYGNKVVTNNKIKIIKDLNINIYKKNVLLIEDIIDLGITINMVYKHLLSQNPKTLNVCTLLKKNLNNLLNVDITYMGFLIPDYFVVGYGMDYADKYRHLPYIGKLILP